MTRDEFQNAMNPMCKALGVKVNRDQADTFFAEFKHHDTRDFAHACRELSMGQPGYLPKLVFFRDNVVAAKEIRQERENSQGMAQIERNLAIGGAGDEWDQRFGRLCLLNIQAIILNHDDKARKEKARTAIVTLLDHPEFNAHTFNWVSRDGQRPQDWLRAQVTA